MTEQEKSGQEKNRFYIGQGIKRAQDYGREYGFEIGSVVGHPSDPTAYLLESIDNGQATLFLPADVAEDGKAVRKTFPLEEIFDPNVALFSALGVKYAPQIKQVKRMFNAPNN